MSDRLRDVGAANGDRLLTHVCNHFATGDAQADRSAVMPLNQDRPEQEKENQTNHADDARGPRSGQSAI